MDLLVDFSILLHPKPPTWCWLRGALRQSEVACVQACWQHGGCGLKLRTVETLGSVLVGIWSSMEFFETRGAIPDFRQFVIRRFTDFGVAYEKH